MMAKTDREKRICLMRRKGSALFPVSQADDEILQELGEGDVEVTFKQRRSLPQLRKYWAMLSDVVAATDSYPTAEHLHEILKYEMGYVKPIRRLNGETVLMPDSVAFSRMGPIEFRGFMDRAIRLIGETHGIDCTQLQRLTA